MKLNEHGVTKGHIPETYTQVGNRMSGNMSLDMFALTEHTTYHCESFHTYYQFNRNKETMTRQQILLQYSGFKEVTRKYRRGSRCYLMNGAVPRNRAEWAQWACRVGVL
ncbi:hypothetical protein ACJX0J_018061, partial [Zea mays]